MRPHWIEGHYSVKELHCYLPIAASIHRATEQGDYSEYCSARALAIDDKSDYGEHIKIIFFFPLLNIPSIGNTSVAHMTLARPLGFHCRCLMSLAATGMLTEGWYWNVLRTSLELSHSLEPAKSLSSSSGSTDVKEVRLQGRQALGAP